jgi:hypothetical protein
MIFALPLRIRHRFSKHLAFVEYFTPFNTAQPPGTRMRQHTIKTTTSSKGTRVVAVVPLTDIKLSCHLTPKFDQMSDKDWAACGSKDSFLDSFSQFYFNDFSSHIMYGYTHLWKDV